MTGIPTAPLLVVIGPSGNGKSTLGTALGAALGVPFEDADDLHPTANVAKMTAGIPLTDDDRAPWLTTVHEHLAAASGSGLVMACSALRRRYRDRLREELPQLGFVAPEVSREVLTRRVAQRQGHYMPSSLVDSQLAAYEPLLPDEPGLPLNGEDEPGALVGQVRRWLANRP
ncbi:AAA family ATPase [Kineosporia sp. J2-2]|uniref:Gluconokinase n=1 Tax=Kineosporia corallincola TaxID=2835133 RepID=A0ABS5TTC9_9ACTN|nr:gluconokinase, GntK/IdnK-type [Kineosporia corallincola]MBT0774071.1 AAA family ATPase [Kineosporia corallincola]